MRHAVTRYAVYLNNGEDELDHFESYTRAYIHR